MDETPAESSEVQSFHFPEFGNNVESESVCDSAVGGANANNGVDGDCATENAVGLDGQSADDLSGRSRLRIEYGRTEVLRSTIKEWQVGSTVELPEKHAEPVTVFVDDEPIAHGDLVEVDGKLGVRIVELVLAVKATTAVNTRDDGARRSA